MKSHRKVLQHMKSRCNPLWLFKFFFFFLFQISKIFKLELVELQCECPETPPDLSLGCHLLKNLYKTSGNPRAPHCIKKLSLALGRSKVDWELEARKPVKRFLQLFKTMRDNEVLNWPQRHLQDKVTKMGTWLDVRVRGEDKDTSDFSSLFDCEN